MHQASQSHYGFFRNGTSRKHGPHNLFGSVQLFYHIGKVAGSNSTTGFCAGNGFFHHCGIAVINDNVVPVPCQADGNVAAHSAQSNNANLHHVLLFNILQGVMQGRSKRCKAFFEISFNMHTQGTALAFGQHIKITTCLSGFYNAKGIASAGHG